MIRTLLIPNCTVCTEEEKTNNLLQINSRKTKKHQETQ